VPFTAGTRIGPYEVKSPLGEGGMGVVFRALDTKLQREVALKLLPDHFAEDPDRLSRFQREAQVLATLNHPNIAQIYGLEESENTRCIVMELVDGETLQERLKRGPAPVDEGLQIAKQICEALEAAHERGIIHTDLKPANIKLTKDGAVKVLDFGLARMREVEGPATNVSNSPTLMTAASMPGMILGTAAYMSPEQACGKVVDRRSDIWSFGAVLYEMLSGKEAFAGESISETLASVIKVDPDWSALPQHTPPSIHTLLRRCLNKDRKQDGTSFAAKRTAIPATSMEPRIVRVGPLARSQPETSEARRRSLRTSPHPISASPGTRASRISTRISRTNTDTRRILQALRFVDKGVGDFLRNLTLNPNSDWVRLAPHFDGKFQVTTLRNVDKRPSPEFIKAYMHNGYFKSLKEVVHFYNTRDTLRRCQQGDPGEKTTCWPAPEFHKTWTQQSVNSG